MSQTAWKASRVDVLSVDSKNRSHLVRNSSYTVDSKNQSQTVWTAYVNIVSGI